MIYLIDSNVLLRVANKFDPLNHIAQEAVTKLKSEGFNLYTTLQNFAEFRNVSTRLEVSCRWIEWTKRKDGNLRKM